MKIYFFYFHEILKLALFHVLVKFLFRQFKTFAGKLKIFSKLNYYLKKNAIFFENSAFCFEKHYFFPGRLFVLQPQVCFKKLFFYRKLNFFL